MNKRKKKRAAAAALTLKKKGQKVFEVTVKETYEATYTVFANSAEEAEEIASERCSDGTYDPTSEKDTEYDNEISAEEVEPCLNHFEPLEWVTFKGENYPVWAVTYGKDRFLVSTEMLERALFTDELCSAYVSTEAQRVDERFAYYADPTTPIRAIVEDVWNVKLKEGKRKWDIN